MGTEWNWWKFSQPNWGRTGITVSKNDYPLSVLASEWKDDTIENV